MAVKETKYRDVFRKVLEVDPELKPILDYALIKEVVPVDDLMDMASSSDQNLALAAQNQLIRQHVKNCVDLGYQQYVQNGGSLSDIIQTYLTKLVEVAHSSTRGFSQKLRNSLLSTEHSSTRGFSQKLRNSLLSTEINTPVQECELSEELPDESEMEEDTIINMMKRDVREILLSPDYLRAREIDIIKFRFGLIDGEPHTLDDCANRYGVTRERARQIEAKALRRMRSRRCVYKHLCRYVRPPYDEL